MASRRKIYFFALWLILLLTNSLWATDFRIIPGQRIGSITLGMSRQEVHRTLHAPNQVCRLRNGIIQESWLSRRKFSQADVESGLYWKWNFVTVYFRLNQVAQVEVNSPHFTTSSKLSTRKSAIDWAKQFKPLRSTNYRRDRYDTGGYPGAKHFMVYDDAVKRGVAWRYGVWGDLAPEPNPNGPLEVVIIHRRRQPVILDPDGGNRFVRTSPDKHLR
ncbi:MAG: hypothetical protein JO316_14670 [Abitibacteriaceae bacterium]|nr:hypothetical protein [Abditibacteriaceae bacterium]MBV9866595.1 hypothetical protein [Abditibacteriaceae bacterium]